MRDCWVKKKAKMIQESEAKEFGNFAADEEQYEPMEMKASSWLDFNQKES